MSEPEAPVDEPYGGSEPRELADEMRTSYLDYAMSVIVGRALPDARRAVTVFCRSSRLASSR